MNSEDPKDSSNRNLIGTDGFNRLRQARYGYVLYNRNDTYVGRSIEEYGEYCQEEAKLLKQICNRRDVVVEVGANIGTHTILLSRTIGPEGRVYAFEPQRIIFQTLCANIALNSLTNVECFQTAAGSEAGKVFIPDIRYDSRGNFGGVRADAFEKGAETPKVALDEFLRLNRLKLIKVDVEGMEAEVLSGAKEIIERFRPVLYVENDRQEKSAELITLIQSMRYRLFWHFPPLYSADNFDGNDNNMFGKTVSANMLCIPQETRADLTGFREVAGPWEYPTTTKGDADR